MDAGGMGIGNYVGAGIQGTTGLVQFAIAMNQAAKDARIPNEMFNDTALFKQSMARAQDMAKQGFTTDEVNSYLQNQTRMNNTRFQKGTEVGGNNLSASVQQGINYGNIASLLNFAAKDAALKRSNIQYADTFVRENQRRADMQTQRDMQLRDQKRAAIAQLANAGVQNFTSSGAILAGGMSNGTGTQGDQPQQQQQRAPQEVELNYDSSQNMNYGNAGSQTYGSNDNSWLYNYGNQGTQNYNTWP